ncbi:hypothetical protein ONE63_010088 [Megalurothrips usitatus]|uniref:Uncharacterized protein n=1 Tax=Megalurothrips usitatus TaxID=439358 RepID=A0AAV7XLG0_9NEOP|nr:hypothetical protein ONE63_010088 [Megalurothrips usitatus]
MRCASRLAGRAPWAALSAAVLAILIATDPAARLPAKFSCSASTPPSSATAERRSSSATVGDGGSNGVADPAEGRHDDPRHPDDVADADGHRFSEAFFQCYADAKQRDSSSALSCVGEGARVGLQSFFTRRDLHVSDGLTLVRQDAADGTEARETPLPFPQDPPGSQDDGQYRSVIDSAAAYLSARALRWEMNGLYPGLVMRVGPTLSGSGWLEFVLEPRRFYSDRQLGPSRTVLKQVVLPFLLGLKVSVASLVPLLLFAIVFLAKKALLMSQLSALVSGLLGFGALGPYPGHPHAFGPEGGGLPFNGHNPLVPLRTSPQVFPNNQRHPPPVEEGPHILQLGGGPLPGVLGGPGLGLSPSWLSGAHQHLFRKVNYDFRDERHAASPSATSTTSTSKRNTKGFRWEDEGRPGDDGDPRAAPDDGGQRAPTTRKSSNAVWGTLSLG